MRERIWEGSDPGANFDSVGSIGLATTTSFCPAKPLRCYGDGCAVFTEQVHDQIIAVAREALIAASRAQ